MINRFHNSQKFTPSSAVVAFWFTVCLLFAFLPMVNLRLDNTNANIVCICV